MNKSFAALFTRSYIIPIITLCVLAACNNLPHAVLEPPVRSTHQHWPVIIPHAINKPEKKIIYVVSHGWHTGVIIQKEDLLKKVPELGNYFPRTKKNDIYYPRHFIEIGWGDKDFYRTHQITSQITLKAMFMAQGSIMHMVDVTDDPDIFFKESVVKKIELESLGYERLLSYINISLQRNQQNQLIHLGIGIYGHSHFFESNGTYSLLNTCNKWTAKALQSGGIKISPTFKLTAGSIMRAINRKEP